jgi:hypothetical protein
MIAQLFWLWDDDMCVFSRKKSAKTSSSQASAENPECRTADAIVGGIKSYLEDWDKQLA